MAHEGDPRVIRIPYLVDSLPGEYERLGFEELGPAGPDFFYGNDEPYRLVRLPERWFFEPSFIFDERRIARAHVQSSFTQLEGIPDSIRVLNVGRVAAQKLYAGNGTLESVQFGRLTKGEVDELVEELHRIASVTTDTGKDLEYARKAKKWIDII